MSRLARCALFLSVLAAFPPAAQAQRSGTPAPSPQGPAPAARAVYLDSAGVVRWRDDRSEVTLFGSNYVVHTASDFRAAGYVGGDRKQMIDEDVAHFARMGWDGMRLTFWGDWQSADSAGNLILNEHLDLLDYLIARARERGIYMLFSPIQLYSANWPDALHLDASTPGFGRVFGKARMGTDAAAIAAQVNYMRQILNHVNPYTGVALKDEPAIVMIELVNEPWHHPEDMPGSVRYINALTDAVRSTGCSKLVFYNVSQDFRIAQAIRDSRAQGVTFGWYPTGLNSGYELPGNHLRSTDVFPDMLSPVMDRMPRIVYEFDSADLNTGTMYPAMARTMREVGSQMALMFAYDMLRTGSRNLGWQTHYLSLAYTPRKALSSIIAAEATRRLPRMRSHGPYPSNTRFGDFRVSYEENLGELVARDAFMYTGNTRSAPPDLAALRRIAGVGSSPLVAYEGLGAYFLDKVRPGVWRLEVYPDAVPVRDPFELPNRDKLVTRAISRVWPMTVTMTDLGATFTVQPVTAGNPASERAAGGRFTVRPGVYVLSAPGPVDVASLPSHVGNVRFAEFFAPPPDTLPLTVIPLAPAELLAGREARIAARVVADVAPDSVTLFIRRTAGDWYRAFSMRQTSAYVYGATVPGSLLREGPYEFVVSAFAGGAVTTFPGGIRRIPWSWDYYERASWKVNVVSTGTPLVLFDPAQDAPRLNFTRIGDAGRRGLFRLGMSAATGRTVFHLELPVDSSGWSPPDYTASLVINDRIRSRREAISRAEAVLVRLRGVGPRQTVYLTLMEDDGTSWVAPLTIDTAWTERRLTRASFSAGRGVLLPQGFPGQWSYWVGPAAGRGGAGDSLRIERVERLQISVRRDSSTTVRAGEYGVEVEHVALAFPPTPRCCDATIRARVPEGTGTLYLAGSLPELGPWRPDGRAMEGTGRDRTVTVTVPPGTVFEYKFTLGEWNREALAANGAPPPNHRLAPGRDTAVTHDVPGFKRDPRDYMADWRGSGVEGRLVYWPDVPSRFLTPTRHVEVWLPPGYDSSTSTRYPVLYMSDGQNLFDPRIANTGVDWGVDEAVNRLVARGVIRPVIVVGVWSTARRGPEYSPWHEAPSYARFLIEELMPRVNAEFRTLTGPANTAHMGSSMGGLLSFYLVSRHPEAFGACGCVSTHFPLSEAVWARVMMGAAPSAAADTTPYVVRDIAAGFRVPRGTRYWFDYGGNGLDAEYGPTHDAVRAWLLRQRLVDGRDFAIRRYPDATHNEASWRARLEDPLTFLYGRRTR